MKILDALQLFLELVFLVPEVNGELFDLLVDLGLHLGICVSQVGCDRDLLSYFLFLISGQFFQLELLSVLVGLELFSVFCESLLRNENALDLRADFTDRINLLEAVFHVFVYL